MNTSQLECFVRVAETRSFQQAADALHISQPAVSKQIAALENELGARLFIRTTRIVSLTPEGEMFLPDARNMLQTTYHARQQFADYRQQAGHVLRVGYTDPYELLGLSGIFLRLRERHKDFVPLMSADQWDVNLAQLENGKLDLCFVLGQDRFGGRIRFRPWGMARTTVLLPAEHPLAQSAFIRYEQIKDEPQICVVPLPFRSRFYSTARQRLFPGSREDKPFYLCNSNAEAITLVLAGFGLCLMPQPPTMQHPQIRAVPCDFPLDLPMGLCFREDSVSPLLREFLQLLDSELPIR